MKITNDCVTIVNYRIAEEVPELGVGVVGSEMVAVVVVVVVSFTVGAGVSEPCAI